jgi:hypothetical protein
MLSSTGGTAQTATWTAPKADGSCRELRRLADIAPMVAASPSEFLGQEELEAARSGRRRLEEKSTYKEEKKRMVATVVYFSV